MKYIPKSAFAQAAGVSVRTFQRWVQQNRQQLLAIGYQPNAKFVSPTVARFICQEYGIDEEDLSVL